VTIFNFGSLPAVDPRLSTVARNTTGQVYALSDQTRSTPLPIRDLSGLTMTSVDVGPLGITEPFQVDDQPQVVWKSGEFEVVLVSFQSLIDQANAAVVAANAASSSAAQAAAAAQQAVSQVQSYIAGAGGGGSSTGGGLDIVQLETYLGGNASGLVLDRVGVRRRINKTGAWSARPVCQLAFSVGVKPGPTDQEGVDTFIETEIPV
jgi:hypothetical protein